MNAKLTLALLVGSLFTSSIFQVGAQAVQIVVGTNTYVEFSTDLTQGAAVFIDADPASGSPVRATQRSLGYREMGYKGILPGTLYFSPVVPKTNLNTAS